VSRQQRIYAAVNSLLGKFAQIIFRVVVAAIYVDSFH